MFVKIFVLYYNITYVIIIMSEEKNDEIFIKNLKEKIHSKS